ncbi:uncharacterized protein M6B38_295310 [Iris pallida]|uniref:Reverse transcriptase domain-containing protein n=1 Tax=Iris pallida TaxID=29817 RepID=A0AAX6HT84_IRIPA|nr:uncharacterized protein M6B38_295310 [Iris pallida]
MCRRMEGIMQDLVSPNQAAFIKGRSIAEHSLLAHEMVREFSRPGGEKACVKLDLRKAYDMVNRDFLCHLMSVMGFMDHWVALIRECITSPTFSVLIQGVPYGYFQSNRGFRQDDPLSPYLFTLVMEYFTCLMDLAVHRRRLVSLFRRMDPPVTHLIYADDLLVFIQPSTMGLQTLAGIMEDLKSFSDLQLNRDKSRVYFSSRCSQKEERADVLGIARSDLPVRYLGVPLTVNYARDQDCQGLVEYVQQRVEGWQAAGLSFGGRIELIRSVISAVAHFWLQSILLPVATIRRVERLCADFLWRGGMHAISWEQLCRPRKEGGVGLRPLLEIREASALKLAWRFISGGSLWADWMHSRYVKQDNFWTCSPDNNHYVTFKSVLRHRGVLKSAIRRVMKDGSGTDLWRDPWIDRRSLLDIRGSPTHTEDRRGLTCSRILRDGEWRPESYRFTEELGGFIMSTVIDPALPADRWIWEPPGASSGSGEFQFRSCYNLIRHTFPLSSDYEFVWCKGLARKMQLCVYKLLLGRLLPRDSLSSFGVLVSDPKCVLCCLEPESIKYIFFECTLAWQIWSEQSRVLGVCASGKYIGDIIPVIRDSRGRGHDWFRTARVRLAAAVWHVWRERNRRIFEGLVTPPVGILHSIEFDVNAMENG